MHITRPHGDMRHLYTRQTGSVVTYGCTIDLRSAQGGEKAMYYEVEVLPKQATVRGRGTGGTMDEWTSLTSGLPL